MSKVARQGSTKPIKATVIELATSQLSCSVLLVVGMTKVFTENICWVASSIYKLVNKCASVKRVLRLSCWPRGAISICRLPIIDLQLQVFLYDKHWQYQLVLLSNVIYEFCPNVTVPIQEGQHSLHMVLAVCGMLLVRHLVLTLNGFPGVLS